MKTRCVYLLTIVSVVVSLVGCAEGPLWKTGYLSPWARQQWANEEQIAATLFTKRNSFREMVDNALQAGTEKQEEASEFLADVVTRDPVLLLRMEATRLLAELPTETAENALQIASRDRQVEVRMAALKAWEQRGDATAEQVLIQMLRTDDDTNIRIGAAAALGQFSGEQVTNALAEVIDDPNPAMQLRAAESLAAVTGENHGRDIQAWQEFLNDALESPVEQTASQEDERPFR
ncbi:MAG: HEAT repeat domain-containing protein [Pirellulaceae bacterium]